MKALYLLIFGTGIFAALNVARAQTPAPSYTQAQAQAGAGLYAQNCAMCHGDAITGRTLVKPGTNPSISGVFGIMVANMPLNQPGSLSHTQYEDIMAYALQKNLYPAGSQPLDYSKTLADSRAFVNKSQ